MSKTLIKFIRDHGKYAKDDIAGFDPKMAQSILDTGAAQSCDASGNFNGPAPSLAPAPAAGIDAARSADLDAREQRLADQEAQLDAKFAEKMAALDAVAPGGAATDTQSIDVIEPEDEADKSKAAPVDVGAAPKQGGGKK